MDEYLADYAERYREALLDIENWSPWEFTIDDIDYFTADLLTIRMLPELPINHGGPLDN